MEQNFVLILAVLSLTAKGIYSVRIRSPVTRSQKDNLYSLNEYAADTQKYIPFRKMSSATTITAKRNTNTAPSYLKEEPVAYPGENQGYTSFRSYSSPNTYSAEMYGRGYPEGRDLSTLGRELSPNDYLTQFRNSFDQERRVNPNIFRRQLSEYGPTQDLNEIYYDGIYPFWRGNRELSYQMWGLDPFSIQPSVIGSDHSLWLTRHQSGLQPSNIRRSHLQRHVVERRPSASGLQTRTTGNVKPQRNVVSVRTSARQTIQSTGRRPFPINRHVTIGATGSNFLNHLASPTSLLSSEGLRPSVLSRLEDSTTDTASWNIQQRRNDVDSRPSAPPAGSQRSTHSTVQARRTLTRSRPFNRGTRTQPSSSDNIPRRRNGSGGRSPTRSASSQFSTNDNVLLRRNDVGERPPTRSASSQFSTNDNVLLRRNDVGERPPTRSASSQFSTNDNVLLRRNDVGERPPTRSASSQFSTNDNVLLRRNDVGERPPTRSASSQFSTNDNVLLRRNDAGERPPTRSLNTQPSTNANVQRQKNVDNMRPTIRQTVSQSATNGNAQENGDASRSTSRSSDTQFSTNDQPQRVSPTASQSLPNGSVPSQRNGVGIRLPNDRGDTSARQSGDTSQRTNTGMSRLNIFNRLQNLVTSERLSNQVPLSVN